MKTSNTSTGTTGTSQPGGGDCSWVATAWESLAELGQPWDDWELVGDPFGTYWHCSQGPLFRDQWLSAFGKLALLKCHFRAAGKSSLPVVFQPVLPFRYVYIAVIFVVSLHFRAAPWHCCLSVLGENHSTLMRLLFCIPE